MAATSDDDVPTGTTATGHDDGSDGDTTAAATAPATTVPSLTPEDEEEEDRTVQQELDPKLKDAARSAASARTTGTSVRVPPSTSVPSVRVPPPSTSVPAPASASAPASLRPSPSPPAPPLRMTSKKPTAVGLGSPLPITRRAAGYDPSSSTTPAAGAPSAAPSTQKVAPQVSVPAIDPRDDDDDSVATLQTEADADDGSITATAPAPRSLMGAASLPLTVPGTVQIRELPSVDDDEALDETEVRTVVSGFTAQEPASTAPLPAAGRPSEPSSNEADEPDDSVTTQAPSAVKNARLPEQDDEPKTSPPAPLAPVPKPIPAAGWRPGEAPPFTIPGGASDDDDESDAYDAEESVTTRGPAVAGYEDDSVTAQAPVARPAAPQAPLAPTMPTFDDGTDGTTKKVAKRTQLPPAASADVETEADLDEEVESITTQAPGHLTNMLRVIASPDTIEPLDDSDDAVENKTAVMLGAPVKPGGAASAGSLRAARPLLTGSVGQGGARAAAVADVREPTSDSGLRIARAEVPSGDHASPSALMAGPYGRGSDHVAVAQPHPDLRNVHDASPAAFAATEQAFNPSSPHGPLGSPHEYDLDPTAKKPRYGLLVGLVAVLSFTIPLVLFLWLHQGMMEEEAPPRTTSEVAPDLVPRGDPARARVIKGAQVPSSSASAAPSTTPAPNHGGSNRPPWFPRRR